MLRLLALALPLAGAQPAALPEGRWVDLTHPFEEKSIYWPTEKGFVLENIHDGLTENGYYYAANRFCSAEHGGTHMDAPVHFFKGRQTADQVPLDRLIGPAAVIDVSGRSEADSDYEIRITDIAEDESRRGPIPARAIVLFKTGYGRHWPDRVRYLGTEERGAQALAKLHFPGLSPEAARWLAERRKVRAVGIDTASIDFGRSTLYKSHAALFEKNIPAFENVANLDELPPRGAFVVALPMKIKGGSGGPLRIVALIPEPGR